MNSLKSVKVATSSKEVALIDKLSLSMDLNTRLLNLVYTIAHNLNGYTGNIKLLLDFVDLEESKQENNLALEQLKTVTNDLDKTISDLSQIVSLQNSVEVKKESISLHSYIEKVAKITNGYNHKTKIEIINTIPQGTFVKFAPAYLESILMNFTTNAIKYAHPDRFPKLEFSLSTKNNQKVLVIADNGIGIDLEKHGSSLFGLFKTFHNKQETTGIGLFITKYQIEAMKAKVSVNSKVGFGTTFKVNFFE